MKKIFPIMLMGLMICLTPAAFADPVQLTGDVLVKYEKDTASGSPDVSGTMSTIRLKATTELGDGWSLYARLGAQHATEPELADYNTAAYRDGKKSVIGLDQFGLTYTRDHMVYKIGRQDATVGTTALLYSRSDSNVGKHYFVDGISAAGKVGAMDISALFAQEDNAGSDNNRIYAIRTGYSPRDDFNFGLTLGRYHYDGGENTNHWAVDGTRSFGKHSLTAEYAKSNSSNENKAYAVTWNYNCDVKTALYITGFRVETNGDMGQQSDFDNDNRGVYYGVTHQFSDADGVELTYKQQKTISGGQDNTKFEATFTHSF